MKWFRHKVISISFLVVTGISFLNMGFFMAEVSMMKGAYNKTALENIVKLVSASLAEEEQDASENTESHTYKVADFLSSQWCQLLLENADIATVLKIMVDHNTTHGGYAQIHTPPPDTHILS